MPHPAPPPHSATPSGAAWDGRRWHARPAPPGGAGARRAAPPPPEAGDYFPPRAPSPTASSPARPQRGGGGAAATGAAAPGGAVRWAGGGETAAAARSMVAAAALVREERIGQLLQRERRERHFIGVDEADRRGAVAGHSVTALAETRLQEQVNATYVDCIHGSVALLDEESSTRDRIAVLMRNAARSVSDEALRRDREERDEAAGIVQRACASARDRHCCKLIDEALALVKKQRRTAEVGQVQFNQKAPPTAFTALSEQQRLKVAVNKMVECMNLKPGTDGYLPPEVPKETEAEKRATRGTALSPRRAVPIRKAASPPKGRGPAEQQLSVGCRAVVRHDVSGGARLHAGRQGMVIAIDDVGDPVLEFKNSSGVNGLVLFHRDEVERVLEQLIVPERAEQRGRGDPPRAAPAVTPPAGQVFWTVAGAKGDYGVGWEDRVWPSLKEEYRGQDGARTWEHFLGSDMKHLHARQDPAAAAGSGSRACVGDPPPPEPCAGARESGEWAPLPERLASPSASASPARAAQQTGALLVHVRQHIRKLRTRAAERERRATSRASARPLRADAAEQPEYDAASGSGRSSPALRL